MTLTGALQGVSRLFLDTTPVIYYVERNPTYTHLVRAVFRNIDAGFLAAVTSPVTLAECLVLPLRQQNTLLQQDFIDLITAGNNTQFVTALLHKSVLECEMLVCRRNSREPHSPAEMEANKHFIWILPLSVFMQQSRLLP